MYIYLGSDTVLPEESIIGVFDMDKATTGKDTRNFLAAAQKAGEVVNVSEDLPKSFAVCEEKGKRKVYILQVAGGTVRKRAKSLGEIQ